MKNSSRLLTTATITGCLTTALCIPATFASTDVTNNDQGWIIHGSENSAAPGGFSAVAEPAGPIDPEAAKRAAEEYSQKCIVPMVWTSPDKQTFNITLLGTPIEVEATPTSFNWDWGDGQTFDTTDPGAPYPNYTVSHPYEVTGNGYVIKLRTSGQLGGVSPGKPSGTRSTAQSPPPKHPAHSTCILPTLTEPLHKELLSC